MSANDEVQQQESKSNYYQGEPKFYKGSYSSPFACEVLVKMGFKPLTIKSDSWSVHLISTKNCSTKQKKLSKMKEWQRHSRFPMAELITQKSNLVKSLRKLEKSGTPVDFLPETFILPDDWMLLRKYAANEKRRQAPNKCPWIVKPNDAAGGHGIFLVNNLNGLSLVGIFHLITKWKKIVISRYIPNPYLIEGLKFDVRLYALVTSFSPLCIYVFTEGIARFCTEPYPGPGDISSLYAHLTNTSLNCHSSKFSIGNDSDGNSGHTRTFSSVINYLAENGVYTEKLMSDIHELIITTFKAVQPKVESVELPSKRSCFQLFGFDILMDDNLKPWLLEVNGNPCLEPYTPMEVPIKARLIRDMFRVVGLYGKSSKHHKSKRKGQFYLIFPKSRKKSPTIEAELPNASYL